MGIMLCCLILLLIGVCASKDFAMALSASVLLASIMALLIVMKSYNGEDMERRIGEISSVQQDRADYLIKVENLEFVTTDTSLKVGDIVKIEYKKKDMENQKCNRNSIIVLVEREK